jgi:hypothetical protein
MSSFVNVGWTEPCQPASMNWLRWTRELEDVSVGVTRELPTG